MISIADIIRLSWQTYISKFKKYLPLLGLIFLFSLVGGVATYYLVDILKLPQIWGLVASAGVSAIVYLLTFGVTILLILYTNQFLQNKKAEFGCQDVLGVFLPALLLSVLVGLIILSFGILLPSWPLFIIPFLFKILPTILAYFFAAGALICLLIPFIVIYVWLAFILFIAILEKKKGLKILKESRELSQGIFGKVFSRLFLPHFFWIIIFVLVITGAVNIIAIILNKASINPIELGTLTNFMLSGILNIISIFFFPFYFIITNIVYRELKK